MVERPIKFNQSSKETLITRVNEVIRKTKKLATLITRIQLINGRIYLHYEIIPFDPDYNGTLAQMLAEKNYAEEPYARITVFTKNASNCSVDWCRHTGQWVSLHDDTLEGCLQFIEEENTYFNFPSSKATYYNKIDSSK